MDIKCFKIVIRCPNPISVILIKSKVLLKTLHSKERKLLERFYSAEPGILFIWLELPGVQLGNLSEHSCGVISSSQRRDGSVATDHGEITKFFFLIKVKIQLVPISFCFF